MKTDIELKKCNVLQKAAYSRDIRPEFQCVISTNCAHNVASEQSDVVVLSRNNASTKENHLQPVVFETYGSSYVVVAKKGLSDDLLKKTAL